MKCVYIQIVFANFAIRHQDRKKKTLMKNWFQKHTKISIQKKSETGKFEFAQFEECIYRLKL